MPLRYDWNAMKLSEKGLNPFLNHMGMIEFEIDNLVPGGRDILITGLSAVSNVPDPRKVSPVEIPYLNGSIKVPGPPGSIGDLTCTFNDYLNGEQRRVLHDWFAEVYDERTGLSRRLISDVKTKAYLVMCGQDGESYLEYVFMGLWPQNPPDIPALNFGGGRGGGGGVVTMTVNFAIDYIVDKRVGSRTNGMVMGQSVGAGGAGGAGGV